MNTKELLSPDVDLSLLRAKAMEILAAIEQKKRSLKNAPEGRLRISQRKSGDYYFRIMADSLPWGEYLPVESEMIGRLAQKDYDIHVVAELQRELKVLDRFLSAYHPENIGKLYASLEPARQKLVTPLRVPDEEFVSAWLAVKYSGRPFDADSATLTTARGERVRSKSEVIIADTLARLNIPYRYEFPRDFKIKGKRQPVRFYPDFTCLSVPQRREFIWEHFGRMDDPAYAVQTAEKIDTYVANGLFPGDGFLFTMETSERPLNVPSVEAVARKFLL